MLQRSLFMCILTATIILSACVGPVTTTPGAREPQANEPQVEYPEDSSNTDVYSEAPMLAKKVAAGELPPLEERLPEEPFVVGPSVYLNEQHLPDWSPGKYGGTLRVVHTDPAAASDLIPMLVDPFLIAPKISDQSIRCNFCQDFEVSADNTTFTFTLRRGLKWSDGIPVTTEDVRFTWEDMYQNENIFPTFPAKFKTGFSPEGNPGNLELIDEYTFKIIFDRPYGAFLRILTIEAWSGYTELLNPSHYLKNYHIGYTNLDKIKPWYDVQNLNKEWFQILLEKRCTNWDMTNSIRCAGYPALSPWIGVKTSNSDVMRFERNPYYFKVDTTGQQLPYIDKIVSSQVGNLEMANLKAFAGEVDFLQQATTLVKMPLYKENVDIGGYRVLLLDTHVDPTGLVLNQTFDDANWKPVVQNIRFRQAISLAINRQELINNIYFGYASLPLMTMGETYAQYDLEEANRLLDEMGLEKKSEAGIRLYADGSTVEILIEYAGISSDIAPVIDLIPQYLKDLGIKVTVKQVGPGLLYEKWQSNKVQSTVTWSHDRGWSNDISSGSVGRAGTAWSIWKSTGGVAGEQPPDWVMEAFDLDKQKWAQVSGSQKYNELVEEGYEWCQNNLPYINFVEHAKVPLIVNKNLMNVPQAGFAISAGFSAVQIYFDNP